MNTMTDERVKAEAEKARSALRVATVFSAITLFTIAAVSTIIADGASK